MSRLVKTGAKFGAVGAVVYYTVEYGVWKDSKRTEQLYKDIYKVVAPLVKENVPIEPPELPKSSEISHFLKSGWNNGVISATHVMTNLPTYSVNLYNQISEWISSQVQEDKSSKS